MPKTKTKPTPVLSRSSSESSLLSIPSPTDESSYDVSKAEEKVKQKINKHAELVRKASKVAKPSTSKASGSRAKQWATGGAKQNEAAASKARKDKENSSSDESLDSDSDSQSQSISFEDVEKLSQKDYRDIYNKKIAKKIDVSMEVPRLKPTSGAAAKKKVNPRDVLEKCVMEPELMQRPQPTKRPAPAQPTKKPSPAQPTKRPAPANVFAEPTANPSKKQKTPERQENADSLESDDSISESQGPIASTPHPNRPFRNAEPFPVSPVENLNRIELQKHLIVTGKKNTRIERRKVCTPDAVKRSLDYSDSNSSEQLSQNVLRTIDIQQTQDRQQRNLSATRSVINATTNSPASTHQLNHGWGCINITVTP